MKGLPAVFAAHQVAVAQALGDFDALAAAGRDVVHYHLDDATTDFTATLERLLKHLGR